MVRGFKSGEISVEILKSSGRPLENRQEVLQVTHKEKSRRIKDVCNIISLSLVAIADAF